MVQHFAQLLLESSLSPLGLLVMVKDLEGWFAGGCASGLGCANVERVANDWIVGGVNGHTRQQLGVAGKDGRKGRIDIETGVTKRFDRAEAIRDGIATRLEDLADTIIVGGEREADA